MSQSHASVVRHEVLVVRGARYATGKLFSCVCGRGRGTAKKNSCSLLFASFVTNNLHYLLDQLILAPPWNGVRISG